MNNWSSFCQAISSRTYQSEADFESHFQQCLAEIFGWDIKEIDRQKNVQFGHERKRIDIALCYDDRYTLVIELKAPNIRLSSGDSAEQISSYMLQTQSEFGILANDKNLQLFYHPLGMRENPKCILDIEFDENDEDGVKLGDFLRRSSYDEGKFKDYCEEKLYLRRVEDLKDLLTSGKGKDLLLEALSADGDSDDWRVALSKIRISRTDGGERQYNCDESIEGKLGLLLSNEGPQIIYHALSNTRIDGKVFTDEMRKEALDGLSITRWNQPFAVVARKNIIRRQRFNEMNYSTEHMFVVTQKIGGLIQLYFDELNNNPEFKKEVDDFIGVCEGGIEWASKNILDPEKLESIPANEFADWLEKEAMPNMPRWKDGMVYRHAYKPFRNEWICEDNQRKLIDNIKFLHSIPEEKRFEAVYELLDKESDRYIRGWGPEAWLTLAAYQFPNQVPRINGETEKFFDILGLKLGGTIDQQLEFVYSCYSSWGTLTGNRKHLTLFQCDNLVAFAMRKAIGQQYMNEQFGANLEVKTLQDRPVV